MNGLLIHTYPCVGNLNNSTFLPRSVLKERSDANFVYSGPLLCLDGINGICQNLYGTPVQAVQLVYETDVIQRNSYLVRNLSGTDQFLPDLLRRMAVSDDEDT